MRGLLKTLLVSVIGVGVVVGALAGVNTLSSAVNQPPDENRLIVAGSTALQPFIDQVANQFLDEYSQARVLVQNAESKAAVNDVAKGRADIGIFDTPSADEPSVDAPALAHRKAAVIGLAVVVNPSVTVANLTTQQLIDIFTRKVTNWQQVGGPDLHIMLVSRAKSSGERATFKEHALNGADEADIYALVQDSSDSVRKMVALMKGAIGYLPLPYVDETVRKVDLNGVEANTANIVSGKYPVWSYGHICTSKDPTGLAKAFADYALGAEAQSILASLGYIPLNEMKVER